MKHEQDREIEFLFEHVIKKRGFFIMNRQSWEEYQQSPDFSRRFRRARLDAKYLDNGNIKLVYQA